MKFEELFKKLFKEPADDLLNASIATEDKEQYDMLNNSFGGDTDLVNNPLHYKGKNGMESIDVIEGFSLGFGKGNAVKYILRSGKKEEEIQDLEKAIWYLNRAINNLKKQ
jgi:hypothetical protein